MKDAILLDLFSGLGGFHLGLEQAGFTFKKAYYSEIDKHAIANYKRNFPDAEYVGSVTDIRGTDIERPNIVTFGSPCQDFSLAGKRKGMGGERSSLISEAIRLITETRPDVFIWENVKGTFSSNDGEDFWAIIQAFTYIGGYRLEWQLLNTSWFLPQNRERIYLVGTLASSKRSEGDIFPIEQETKRTNERAKQATGNVPKIAIKQKPRGNNKGGLHDICPTITSNSFEHNNHVEAIAVLTPDRLEKRQNGRRFKENGEPAFTLTSQDKHGVLVDKKIRRLTEIECTRLQGFPDDHTKHGIYDGVEKEISATQRYKLLGNSVSVPVVKAVAEKIINIMPDRAG